MKIIASLAASCIASQLNEISKSTPAATSVAAAPISTLTARDPCEAAASSTDSY